LGLTGSSMVEGSSHRVSMVVLLVAMLQLQ